MSITTTFLKIQSYVHRIGRTGRAGLSGQSITFVSPNEMGYLAIIEDLTKRMKGLKSATAQEALKLRKKKIALKRSNVIWLTTPSVAILTSSRKMLSS